MTDFLRVSELLEAFPNPAAVTVQAIRDRFGVCRPVAGQARALAIDLVMVQHLQRTLGVSRCEAEALYQMDRPTHTKNGYQVGIESHAVRRGWPLGVRRG